MGSKLVTCMKPFKRSCSCTSAGDVSRNYWAATGAGKGCSGRLDAVYAHLDLAVKCIF